MGVYGSVLLFEAWTVMGVCCRRRLDVFSFGCVYFCGYLGLFLWIFECLFQCLFQCLFECLFQCLFQCLFECLFECLFQCLFECLFQCLFECLRQFTQDGICRVPPRKNWRTGKCHRKWDQNEGDFGKVENFENLGTRGLEELRMSGRGGTEAGAM